VGNAANFVLHVANQIAVGQPERPRAKAAAGGAR